MSRRPAGRISPSFGPAAGLIFQLPWGISGFEPWSKSPSRGMGCLVFSAAKPSSNMFISKPSLYRRSCNQLAWSLKPLETTRKLTMISWFAVAGLPRKEF
jgi:hypothetical protein